MKILICGDRRWADNMPIYNRLAALKAEADGDVTILEGGADGADWIAYEVAHSLGLKVKTFPAEWKRWGRAAGPSRNLQMLDERPDLVIAFHANLNQSRGTKHCVTEARRRGIAVEVIER